jgi:Domain of unknown function DUF1829/Domain of unknown function DUF1828
MILEVRELIDEYANWLKDKITLRQIDNWVEITTPFLDRHNDHLQIFAKKNANGDTFELTDDGYTIADLQLSGCNLDTPKREELLRLALNGFGVKLEGKALVITATPKTFPYKKHSLIQAMLAVNDLFYLASPMVKSLFLEDVTEWLNDKDIRYVPNTKFTGASGFDHLFEFVIPSSKVQPERMLKTINRPNNDAAKSVAFAWMDIQKHRQPNARAYAIINDSEHEVSKQVVDALESYDIKPVVWSERNASVAELAA